MHTTRWQRCRCDGRTDPRPPVGCDEAVALVVAEPLDRSGCHQDVLLPPWRLQSKQSLGSASSGSLRPSTPCSSQAAPVSSPLHWDELRKGIEPRDFTMEVASSVLTPPRAATRGAECRGRAEWRYIVRVCLVATGWAASARCASELVYRCSTRRVILQTPELDEDVMWC